MELFRNIKKIFSKTIITDTSFPKFKVDVPMPTCKPYNAQDKVTDSTKNITTYQLVQELNRRKNENHDGYEINFVIGKNTGDVHIGNQTPHGKNHICHACGLGYKCLNKDCPNTKINTNDIFMY